MNIFKIIFVHSIKCKQIEHLISMIVRILDMSRDGHWSDLLCQSGRKEDVFVRSKEPSSHVASAR